MDGAAGDHRPVSAGEGGLDVPRAAGVELEGVTKSFGPNLALDGLSLDVPAGEFLVLLGPSGCGKTTVLRLVAGLEEPTRGVVRIGDQVMNGVDPKERDVAMVFQSYALYPHLSVRRNIEFPLRSRHVDARERMRLVAEVSSALQIGSLLDRKPAEISGGQRQRVALARAIVRRPRVFLMDEPLSNLDAQLRVEMRAELVELHQRLGSTILYVTHDQVEAMTMGDRIAIMNHGVLQQVDTPEKVHDRPANAFVAGFIGSPPMNILAGVVEPVTGDTAPARSPTPADRSVGGTDAGALVSVGMPGGSIPLGGPLAEAVLSRGLASVIVGVRPEHVSIDPAGSLAASVTLVESLGHERHVVCRLEAGQLVVARLAAREAVPRTGERVSLSFSAEHLQLFEPDTEARIDV